MSYTNPEFLPKLAEWHVYGNEQQGRFLTKYPEELNPTYYGTEVTLDVQNNIFKRQLGKKSYELKDHLGNVRVTHSDIKMPTGTPAQPFMVDLLSRSEYYPYGMKINDLSYNATGASARYGYNGKEQDNEVKGNNNSLDFGARIYDPRVSRFLSQDPMKGQFAFQSPYIYAGNSPMNSIDENGEYKKTVYYQKDDKGNFSNVKISTDNSLRYTSINLGHVINIPFASTVPLIPNTVEYIRVDSKGNVIHSSGDLPLKNIGSTRYPGPRNPEDIYNKILKKKEPDYRYPPINSLDLAGMLHDKAYDANDASGATGAFLNRDSKVIQADLNLVKASLDVVKMFITGQIDPVSNQPVDLEQAEAATAVAILFLGTATQKSLINTHLEAGKDLLNQIKSLSNEIGNLPSNLKEAAYKEVHKMGCHHEDGIRNTK